MSLRRVCMLEGEQVRCACLCLLQHKEPPQKLAGKKRKVRDCVFMCVCVCVCLCVCVCVCVVFIFAGAFMCVSVCIWWVWSLAALGVWSLTALGECKSTDIALFLCFTVAMPMCSYVDISAVCWATARGAGVLGHCTMCWCAGPLHDVLVC